MRILCALLLGALVAGAAAADSEIRLVPCSVGSCVAVGLTPEVADALSSQSVSAADWKRVFAVRTEEAATSRPVGPTLFGRYALQGSTVVFRPRLPLLSGKEYQVTVDLGGLSRLAEAAGAVDLPAPGADLELTFSVPAPSRDVPRVVTIHPTSSHVPGNLLRAYVEFSTVMRPDVISDYLHLVDSEGVEVELPFVEIDGGLWDPQGKRLTLLFHPGRLKRGVAPREELGPPLEIGRTYRLQIDAGWPAATGEPLSVAASRSWVVDAEDRTPVVPGEWKLESPGVGSTEPLQVDFGKVLDQALALRMITVLHSGEPVEGKASLSAGDAGWTFRPSAPWTDGDYVLRVHPNLEDLAGNNLRGVFDRGEGQGAEIPESSEVVFRPRN